MCYICMCCQHTRAVLWRETVAVGVVIICVGTCDSGVYSISTQKCRTSSITTSCLLVSLICLCIIKEENRIASWIIMRSQYAFNRSANKALSHLSFLQHMYLLVQCSADQISFNGFLSRFLLGTNIELPSRLSFHQEEFRPGDAFGDLTWFSSFHI